MKPSYEQRVRTAMEYHCGDIGRARRLLGLLSADFFSHNTEQLTEEKRHKLEMNLIAWYDTIVAVLDAVDDILFNVEVDMDAAAGIETRAAQIRKENLCAIYGLTKDKEAAPDAAASKTARGR